LIEPFFNSVVLVHQLSSVWKDGSKKKISWKGFKYAKMLENWRIFGTWTLDSL